MKKRQKVRKYKPVPRNSFEKELFKWFEKHADMKYEKQENLFHLQDRKEKG
ncbi:hypothetical protein IGI96_003854 [Enterococcus sp. DIV0421]|uniref:hypothetical protein n=1 Tax=Enterococcus sp. DIV0421 TaxID=2774688 RepID=UPI003F287098